MSGRGIRHAVRLAKEAQNGSL